MNDVTDGFDVCLRPVGPGDIDFIIEQETHPDNIDFINSWSRKKHLACLEDSNHAHFIVERIKDRRPVGFAILIGLNDPSGNLEFMRLAISEKGRGYGRQVMRLAKRFAFEQTEVHRLWLDVIDYNDRAYRLYESEGFIKEGVLREAAYYNGRRSSLIIMSILRSEYRA